MRVAATIAVTPAIPSQMIRCRGFPPQAIATIPISDNADATCVLDRDLRCELRVGGSDHLLPDNTAKPHEAYRCGHNDPGPDRSAHNRADQRCCQRRRNDEDRRSDLGQLERQPYSSRPEVRLHMLSDRGVDPDHVAAFTNVVRHRDQ